MSKVLKIRVGRSGKKKKGKKKKGRSTYNRVSNFFICDRNAANGKKYKYVYVHDVHETHFPLYYSSACSYRKLCRLEKCFFLGSGPKIGSVGTLETDNQLDVPLEGKVQIVNFNLIP